MLEMNRGTDDMETDQPNNSVRRRLDSRVLIVFGVLLVILLLSTHTFIPSIGSAHTESMKVSNQFVAYLENDDGADAYTLTSPDLRSTATQDQLTKAFKQIDQRLTAKPALITNLTKVTRKHAVYTYRADTLEGLRPMVVVVDYIDGTWLVNSCTLGPLSKT